jgi:hypothetical protein
MKKNIYFLSILCMMIITSVTAQVNLSNGLLAYYPFTQSVNDAMPNPANGTVTGATLVVDKGGNASSAYNFSQAGDKISVGQSSKLNLSSLTAFTFSVWVKPSSFLYLDERIISFYGNNYGLEIDILGTVRSGDVGRVQVLDFNGNTLQPEVNLFSDVALTTNAWNNIIATFDVTSGSTKLYINGLLAGQVNHSMVLPNGDGFVIGNHVSNDWRFDGVIDEVRIYNRIVNADEIAALAELTTTTTAVNEQSADHINLSLYPNPVKDVLHISANLDNSHKVSIINVMGQSVYSSFYTNEINTATLPKGMYLLQITNSKGEKVSTKKIVLE